MDWMSIAALAGSITGAALLVFVSYRYGRVSVLKEQAINETKIKDEQLEAAANPIPATDRLQQHNF